MRKHTYLAFAAFSMLACSSNIVVGVGDSGTADGGADSGMGVTCGDTVCEAGAVCCEGCPGDTPTCSGEGGGCPAIACQPVCGSEICGEGQACCRTGCGTDDIGCTAGGACPEIACPALCEGVDCLDDSRCCPGCPGEPSMCVPVGDACPSCGTTPVICNGEVCEGSAPTCCPGCAGDAPVCAPDGACPPVACPPPVVCDGEVCEEPGAACCPGCGGASFCSTGDGVCPAIDCAPVCEAMDVRFVGGCEPSPRWWFDGERCISGEGCSCEGADCDRTFADEESCEAAFSSCAPGACGAMDASGVGFCDLELGVVWDGSSCRSISGCDCEGADCGRLFMDTASCQRAFSACDACTPTDAAGVGGCEAIIGVVWDGRDCRAISGCDCEGSECDSLYESTEECRADRSECRGECAATDARGTGACLLALGVIWDGTMCTAISGCDCEGSECDLRYDSFEECRADRAACL